MKIAILGFAGQGQSAYEYWREGNEITICDQDESIQLPDGVGKKLGSDYLKSLGQYDLLVRTPALHPRSIVEANSETPNILEKVTTVTNEFFRVCPTKNIIGVTGTKGKGTTSTLIAKMLEAAGKRVHLGGNIGTPPLNMLKNDVQPDDWVVLELANFQLIDLKTSPHIAVCLMVEAEHMDWHKDLEEYIAAKQQLFVHQAKEDIAIYYAKNENSLNVADSSSGKLIPYFAPPGAIIENDDVVIDGQNVCSTDELKLLGQHNWQNVCAAVTAVWQVTQDVNAMRSVLTSFVGLEHRLEFVREIDDVKYYDDSFGTTPGTAQVAIEAFAQPKVLILGGSDKGADYDELAKTVQKNNVRAVISIGVTGPAITETLNQAGFTNVFEGGSNMAEIVAAAQAQAQAGDIILLSTACASFDMFKNYQDRGFKNYQDRGEQFKKAVQALA
jgi:UDP-N-acetylmuramoylalanine--D-glutamate ligase